MISGLHSTTHHVAYLRIADAATVTVAGDCRGRLPRTAGERCENTRERQQRPGLYPALTADWAGAIECYVFERYVDGDSSWALIFA